VAPLRSLVDAVERLAERGEATSPTLVADFAREIRYDEEVERTYQDARVRESRKAFVAELQQAWERHLRESSRPALADFVDEIALQDRQDDRDAGPGVTLSTVHAAKGLEWDVVFVAGVEEGNFPHCRSVDDGAGLDEERRLFYVAVTRARHRLFLTWTAERESRGKRVKRVPSRFLQELPAGAVARGDADAPASGDSVAASLHRMRSALRAAREG
jgi:DNA helicase-2/ATP-dependent DNA helicase PcrA